MLWMISRMVTSFSTLLGLYTTLHHQMNFPTPDMSLYQMWKYDISVLVHILSSVLINFVFEIMNISYGELEKGEY